MWTRSHTSLPTIWCDLTFPLLALVSHTAPLQNTTNMMISARGGCHLPLQSVLREGCFAYSGPFTSVLTFFSKSYWTVALFVRGVKGATKSPRPRICLPSQHAQPRNGPRWSLRPSPKDLAAAPLPARRSGWQQGCIRDTLRHTHRGPWSGCLDRLLHTHTEQPGQHNPSVMLPKLTEGHTDLSSSSPPGNQNAGSLVNKCVPSFSTSRNTLKHAQSPWMLAWPLKLFNICAWGFWQWCTSHLLLAR